MRERAGAHSGQIDPATPVRDVADRSRRPTSEDQGDPAHQHLRGKRSCDSKPIRSLAMVTLPVLHFNDVYRVQPFKASPHSTGTIDVTQWAAMLEDVRDTWPERTDGKRDGLVLFSGDVFAPSTESSVTRGSHMVCHELE